MKRFYKFLMPLAIITAMAMPWTARAQDSLTVADGTTTNAYVPIYGFWADADQHNQIIYPASMLQDMTGSAITSMTFYMSTPASSALGTTATIRMTEVTDSTLSGLNPDGPNGDEVWVGVLNCNTSLVEISFDVPYVYAGGNLLVDISTTAATYSSTTWTGILRNNSSHYSYNSTSTTASFLPKTTFTYSELGDFCMPPTNVTVSNITTDGFTLTWGPSSSASSYVVRFGENEYSVTDTSYIFTELNANTPYTVMVAAICSDTSSWRTVNLRTACATIDTLPYILDLASCQSGGNNAFDPCWSIGNTYSTSTYYPYYVSSSGYLYTYFYGSGYYAYAMLPTLGTVLDDVAMELSFKSWNENTSYGGGLIVALFDSNAYDATSVIDTVAVIVPTATAEANAETFYVPFTGHVVAGKRIGFLLQNQKPGNTSSYYYNYLKDINLHEAPNCFVPSNLVGNAAQADSVVLSWTDTLADAWQIAIGPAGFNPDTIENYIESFETSYVFEELVGGITYEAYVRANCGDEQSFWIGPAMLTPGAIMMGVTGSATMYACNAVIYDDGGPTDNYSVSCNYTLTLYPSDSTKRFKFWGEGSTESGYDYLRIYPGTVASGTYLATIASDNQIIDTVTTQGGPITLYFYSDPSVTRSGFEIHIACVDMASCRDIENVTVVNASTSSAYVTWETAVGTSPMPSSYIVTVTDTTGETVTSLTTSEMFAMVGGLTANTDYVVSIVPACDEANGEPATASFTTSGFGCLQVDATQAFSDTIGNGTATSTYLPSNSFYNYSLSQQIYTAAEIGHGGEINSVSIMMQNVSSQRTFEIYMGHTSDATASSFLNPADLTLVYDGGAVAMVADEWTTFNLTTPFNYNGTDNLVVFFRDMTGSYVSGNAGYVHDAASGSSRYIYQDNTPFTPGATTGGTSLAVRNNIILAGAPCAVIATCANPLVVMTGSDVASVSLMWAAGGSESSWTLQHMAEGDATWTTDLENTSNTSHTVSDLLPNTEYFFRVYHVCGTDTFATVRSMRTPCVGVSVPFSENFATWGTGSSASLPSPCWFKGSSYDATYPYVTTGNSMPGDNNSMYFYASGTTLTYLALPKFEAPLDTLVVSGYIKYSSNGYTLQIGRMSDPEDGNTFQAVGMVSSVADQWVPFEVSFAGRPDGYVAFAVGNGGSYSNLYLDNIEVNYYNPCERPTNVVDSASTQNSVVISWTDTVTNEFEVEYGPVGFQHGQGMVQNVTGAHSVTLTGLNHSSRYDVYVRGACDGGIYSEWSFVHQFNTQCGNIDVLPYTEHFEDWGTGSNVHAPMCWAYGSDYSSYYPYITTNSDHGGVMYLYVYDDNHVGQKTWFALPALDSATADVNQTQVVFSAYSSGSNGYPVMVGVGNSNSIYDSSIVWIDTVEATSGDWTEHEVLFDTYTGNGRYIFFATFVASGSSSSSPYIDDITLEMIPSCRRPDSLTVSNATTTSVQLSWVDRSAASSWVIEYGPRGFQPGTGVGTVVSANSNPFTLTGLPVAYQGEYYVRTVCSSTDTSDYSRRPCAFETTQIPATLPYTYDFENVTEWNNWQTSSNVATNWFRGNVVADSASSYSMYISADSGATYKPYLHNAVVNAAAYRDIDFGPIDSSYTLTFRARAGGTTTGGYDGLMVLLVDPSVAAIASNDNLVSPWGDIRDLRQYASVRLDTTWQTYYASFDTISGVHRVAFFWFNQNTQSSSSYPNLGEPAAVDNIDIRYSTCPRPLNLEATPSINTALLTWDGPANANYQVSYRRVGDTVIQNAVATTNSITLTGLVSPGSYVCQVRKLCGAGDTSLYSDGVRFSMLCSPITTFPWLEDFNGYDATGYSTAGSMPDDCWDAYSDGTSANYVPHVTSGGSSSYQYSPDNTKSVVMVASSSANNSYGQNVLIGLPQFGAPVSSLTFKFWYRFESTSYGVLEVGYMVGDDYSADFVPVDTLPAISNDGATDSVTFVGAPANASRIAIRWTNPQTSTWYSLSLDNFEVTSDGALLTCDAPAIVSSAATETTASVTFTSEAPANQVAIVTGTVAADEFQPANAIDVADTTYTFQGLTASTDYTIGVRAVCSDELVSDWVLTHVRTDDHPCYTPTGVAVSGETLHGATISWTAGEEGQSSFEVHVYNNTYNETYTVQATSYEVTGLYMNTAYNVEVRAVCGENYYSGWTAAEPFTTADCVAPTGVTATANGRDVTVSWQSTGASRYRVAYFDEFTSSDNATVVEVEDATSTTVTVPEGDMQYSFFVYAYCDNVLSNPSDEVTVDILGIGDVNMSEVTLYPNPASTTVTVSGLEGENTVTVVDMNGRTVYTATATADLTIDLTGMAKGAYFVRITGEQATAVRKLIVR